MSKFKTFRPCRAALNFNLIFPLELKVLGVEKRTDFVTHGWVEPELGLRNAFLYTELDRQVMRLLSVTGSQLLPEYDGNFPVVTVLPAVPSGSPLARESRE